MENYLQRIKKYIDYKGLSNRAFEASVEISHGLIAKNIKVGSDLSAGVVINILKKYPEINPSWLLLGEGQMLRGQMSTNIDNIKEYQDEIIRLQGLVEEYQDQIIMLVRDKRNLEKELQKKAG